LISKSNAVVDFLDQDYGYTSIVTQVPRDIGLALVHAAKFQTRDSASAFNMSVGILLF
jgi:hypothetical protein